MIWISKINYLKPSVRFFKSYISELTRLYFYFFSKKLHLKFLKLSSLSRGPWGAHSRDDGMFVGESCYLYYSHEDDPAFLPTCCNYCRSPSMKICTKKASKFVVRSRRVTKCICFRHNFTATLKIKKIWSVSAPKCQSQNLIQPLLEPFEQNLSQNSPIKCPFHPAQAGNHFSPWVKISPR